MDRVEVTGAGIALIGHAALLAALTFGLALAGNPMPVPLPMEVSFVEEIGLASSSPEPTREAPALGAAPTAGPVEDASSAAAPAPAAPESPTLLARERASLPQRQAIAAPPAPATRRPPESRTSRPLTSDILAGIGSDPVSRSNRRPAAMTGEARASITAAIRRALVPCERQPLPAPEAGAIKVDVRVALNRDGSLAAADVVRVINPNPALGIYERRMRDLALAIVHGCTPIRGLPDALYDVPRGWRQFTYQFDPRLSR